jgi:hypothetical protein
MTSGVLLLMPLAEVMLGRDKDFSRGHYQPVHGHAVILGVVRTVAGVASYGFHGELVAFNATLLGQLADTDLGRGGIPSRG